MAHVLAAEWLRLTAPHIPANASYFFSASASAVKIHSRTTGEVVSTLLPPRLTTLDTESDRLAKSSAATVTGILIHPANPMQLLTSSMDGTIRVWDFLDAILLRTIDVGFPITHLTAHRSNKDGVYVAIRKPKALRSGKKPDPFDFTGRSNSIIYSVSLALASNPVVGSKGQRDPALGLVGKPRVFMRIGKTREASGLQVSSDGQWLIAIGNRKVQIARTNALREGFTKYVSDERLVTLAFHPSQPIFATGDAVGKIRIWHCLDEAYLRQSKEAGVEKRAPSSVLHWHAHAVSSLSYTPNGAYLVSGGEEAVLVLWQLSTGQREYVPRLGAPINSISIAEGLDGREQEFALSLADGSITFVGAINLKTNRTFARVKIDPSRHLIAPAGLASVESPLAIEPVTGQLVLSSGHPGSLQFLDAEDDRVMSELEVAPTNRVSRPDDTPLEPTRVEQVAFSQRPAQGGSGPAEWMATFERRKGGGQLSSDLALKIWRWSTASGRYELNTRVDKPHGSEGLISSMSFSPVGLRSDPADILFVSTGTNDRKTKIWKLASHRARGGRTETYWVPRSIFGYRDHKPAQARWSPDGSLLGVAQGPFLTIWEPLSNTLLASLSCPELKAGVNLAFLGKAGRFVAVTSTKTIVVWDLVKSNVRWHKTYDEGIHSILSHSATVEIFRNVKSQGVQRRIQTIVESRDMVTGEIVHRGRLPFAVRATTSFPRRLSTNGSTPFVAIDNGFDVYKFGLSVAGPGSESSRAENSGQSLRSITVKRRTLFDDIFGSVEPAPEDQDDSSKALASDSRVVGSREVASLFDAPAHLLPPVQMLFDSYVSAVLPLRKITGTAEKSAVSKEGNEEASNTESIDTEDDVSVVAPLRNKSKEETEEDMEFLTDLFTKQLLASRSNGQPQTVRGATNVNGNGTVKAANKGRKSSGKKSSESSAMTSEPAKQSTSPVNGGSNSHHGTSSSAGKKRKSLS